MNKYGDGERLSRRRYHVEVIKEEKKFSLFDLILATIFMPFDILINLALSPIMYYVILILGIAYYVIYLRGGF